MPAARKNYRTGPTESELKARFLTELVARKLVCPKAIIASELPLDTRSTRVDLAVLDSDFIGIEIKSNRDSLKRLESQLTVYRDCFDLILLLVGDRHLKRAATFQMPNLELWVADDDKLELVHPATKREPASRRDELVDVFRRRFSETSKRFWALADAADISTKDLRALSRFAPQRELAAMAQQERAMQWQQWEAFLNDQSTHSSSVS